MPLFLFLTGVSPPTLAAIALLKMKTLKNMNTINTDNVHGDKDVDANNVVDDTFFFIFIENRLKKSSRINSLKKSLTTIAY